MFRQFWLTLTLLPKWSVQVAVVGSELASRCRLTRGGLNAAQLGGEQAGGEPLLDAVELRVAERRRGCGGAGHHIQCERDQATGRQESDGTS